jgi:hypothetical protein
MIYRASGFSGWRLPLKRQARSDRTNDHAGAKYRIRTLALAASLRYLPRPHLEVASQLKAPVGVEVVLRGIPRNRAEDGPALWVQKMGLCALRGLKQFIRLGK